MSNYYPFLLYMTKFLHLFYFLIDLPKSKVWIKSGFFKRHRKNIYCVEKYLNREY